VDDDSSAAADTLEAVDENRSIMAYAIVEKLFRGRKDHRMEEMS
jgi:hypothetical protein